ncbi:MAG: hypothetical protein OXE52_10410 [Chloroflexi bacterium]|nr:hypothetical protein [Chloroflexota bacterium]
MNRLLLSIFWLIVIVPSGIAQDAAPETEPEDDNEVTVMSLDDDPLPDADVLVLFGPPHEFYEEQNFSGDGDWYHSSDLGSTWSELDNPSQIQTPSYIPTEFKIFSAFEGGIADLGLGEYEAESDTHIHVIRDANLVYIMNEEFLHIVDLSTHIIASIDYYNGLYCTPWDEFTMEADYPENVLLRCFDLFYFEEASTVKIQEIQEIQDFKLGVSQILDSFSPFDHQRIEPAVAYYHNPPDLWISPKGWARWSDIDERGPYRLDGIALNKRLLRYDFVTGDYVDLSKGKAHSRRIALTVLSSLLASDLDLNVHLMSRDWFNHQYLIWNLSNIYRKTEI